MDFTLPHRVNTCRGFYCKWSEFYAPTQQWNIHLNVA